MYATRGSILITEIQKHIIRKKTIHLYIYIYYLFK